MTTSPNRASREMVELAPVVPHSKTRIWVDRCLPTLLVVSKVVTAVIPDPLVDSRKEAMPRQPYGTILPSCTPLSATAVSTMTRSLFSKTFIKQRYLSELMQQRLTVVQDGRA